MIAELDPVVLTCDLPEHPLAQGDVGTVVHVYDAGAAVEVEFVSGDGHTVAVVTLPASDVRPLGAGDVLHARTLAA